MSAEAAVLEGRTAAEELMVDSCTITRVTGRELNPATKAMDDVVVPVYAGRCRLNPTAVGGQPQHSTVDAGDRQVFQQQRTARVPIAVTDLQVGDVLTVTSSVLDPDLAGRGFQVLAVEHGTHLTARRLTVQERTT